MLGWLKLNGIFKKGNQNRMGKVTIERRESFGIENARMYLLSAYHVNALSDIDLLYCLDHIKPPNILTAESYRAFNEDYDMLLNLIKPMRGRKKVMRAITKVLDEYLETLKNFKFNSGEYLAIKTI